MSDTSTSPAAGFNEELWQVIFGVGHPVLIEKQQRFGAIGAPPRCKLCLAPFGAEGGADVPAPSNRNPRFCSLCDAFIRANPGGAKVRMAMLFADVRHSTELAESLELSEYVRRMNAYYRTVSQVVIDTDGFMLEVVGDQVFALYPTGFSGVAADDPPEADDAVCALRRRRCALKAIEAGRRLAAVSAGGPAAFEFGVSVHAADVFIGTIQGAEEGIVDVRVWGPQVNLAARLSDAARGGEALVTDAACEAAGLSCGGLDGVEMALKGLARPVTARRIAPESEPLWGRALQGAAREAALVSQPGARRVIQ
jgi:adenylate cyclase